MVGPIRYHSFTPEEYFDLGGGGEHPVTYKGMVERDFRNGGEYGSASLESAIVSVTYEGMPVQKLDVTKSIRNSPATLRDIEDQIYDDYVTDDKVADRREEGGGPDAA